MPTNPAEIAKAIAYTIDSSTAKGWRGPLAFVSATSHDNVVEVRYATRDAQFFESNKANANNSQLTLARYYCNPSRSASLNSGVVIHQVMTGPDGQDSIEFTVDRSTCASLLAPPKPADSATLATMAQTIVMRENAERKPSAPDTKNPFRLDAAIARGSVVEMRFIVDQSAAQNASANRSQIAGVLQGYYCSKYGDNLRQGLSLHHVFTAGGSATPLFDFTMDKTSC
jgi:hypothetical protein